MLNIITDSSAEFEQEEAERLGIRIIPLTIVFGNEAYLEGIDLHKDEFYTRLLAGEYPHTSMPSTEQFREAFEASKGEETLVMLISSALSGTVNTARLVAQDFPNVHVYDSLCTTAILRYLVEEAIRHRDKSAEEVISILNDLRPRIRLYACLDTLDYLWKGGRIKRSIAVVGGLLGIKPVITVNTDEGTVEMYGKAHGMKKALKALADNFNADDVDPAYPVYFLQTNTDTFTRQVMADTGNDEARIFRICCAVGTHIGPNAAGIVYIVK